MDDSKILAFFCEDIGKAKARYLAKLFYQRTFFTGEPYDRSEAPLATLERVFEELTAIGALENGVEEFLEGLLEELELKYGDVGCDAYYYMEQFQT